MYVCMGCYGISKREQNQHPIRTTWNLYCQINIESERHVFFRRLVEGVSHPSVIDCCLSDKYHVFMYYKYIEKHYSVNVDKLHHIAAMETQVKMRIFVNNGMSTATGVK